jgi:hypothetical protein
LSQYPPPSPQYPLPYTTPQGPYGGYPAPQGPPPSPDQLLAPARWAGITMIVMGALAVMFGLAVAVTGAVCLPELLQRPEFQPMREQFDRAERESGISAQQIMVRTGAVPLAIGAVLGALGFVVRGGTKGAITASLVVVSITVVLQALMILVMLVQLTASGQAPQAILVACFYGVPLLPMLLILFWLVQAARAVPKVEWARQHYQSQLAQYQQYQQAYLQNAQQQQPPPGQQGTYQPPAPQPPPSGMGYHISTPPITPSESEKKDPPDAPPPPVG